MKVSLSTANLIMTDLGWLSPFDLHKNKEVANVLVLKNEEWEFVKIGDIEQKNKGKPFICKGHGHPEFYLVKKDNELLSTKYERVWDKDEKKMVRSFSSPEYSKAEDMEKLFWASPTKIRTKNDSHKCPIPETNENFWFIGYYLGLGKREKGMNMTLQAQKHNAKTLEFLMDKLGIFFKKDSYETFNEYYVTNRKWNEFLNREFPKTEWSTAVPFWIFNVSKESKSELFSGFMAAIGSKSENNFKFTTRDKGLMLTMKLIAQELDYSVGVYLGRGTGDNQSWQVVTEEVGRSSAVIGDFRYGLVREIKEAKDRNMNIWELEIEKCSGILVDGIILK